MDQKRFERPLLHWIEETKGLPKNYGKVYMIEKNGRVERKFIPKNRSGRIEEEERKKTHGQNKSIVIVDHWYGTGTLEKMNTN